jgi:hypothetical protein
MREMFSGSMITIAIAGAAGVVSLSVVGTHAQGPAASGTATAAASLKTPWRETIRLMLLAVLIAALGTARRWICDPCTPVVASVRIW